MGANLATKSLGGVGGFYPWLLHNNGIDPETGFRLTLGDGTELPFWIDQDGVSLINDGGHKLALRHALSADGELALNKTAPQATLLADLNNSTTVGAAVPDFSLNLEADKTYKISGMMVCNSTATNRGVQLRMTGPSASVSWMHIEFQYLGNNNLATGNMNAQRRTDFASYFNAATAPEGGSNYITFITGMLKTNGVAPATPVGMEMRSSVDGPLAILKAGSWLKFEEI